MQHFLEINYRQFTGTIKMLISILLPACQCVTSKYRHLCDPRFKSDSLLTAMLLTITDGKEEVTGIPVLYIVKLHL